VCPYSDCRNDDTRSHILLPNPRRSITRAGSFPTGSDVPDVSERRRPVVQPVARTLPDRARSIAQPGATRGPSQCATVVPSIHRSTYVRRVTARPVPIFPSPLGLEFAQSHRAVVPPRIGLGQRYVSTAPRASRPPVPRMSEEDRETREAIPSLNVRKRTPSAAEPAREDSVSGQRRSDSDIEARRMKYTIVHFWRKLGRPAEWLGAAPQVSGALKR